MTREEAIHILDNLNPTNTESSFDGYVVGEAITMAIKALEQEPCEDATLKDIFCMGCEYKEQEPCEDCISRKYLLHNCVVDKVTMPYVPISKIENAPPVTPPPKTGHWIGDKAFPICPKCNCNIIEEYISCSDYAEMYKPMKYCPNCGAKMVEPQESEEI